MDKINIKQIKLKTKNLIFFPQNLSNVPTFVKLLFKLVASKCPKT